VKKEREERNGEERERDHLSDWRRDTDSYRKREKERKKGALSYFSFFSIICLFSPFVSFSLALPLTPLIRMCPMAAKCAVPIESRPSLRIVKRATHSHLL
jgi:hypothetical protein